MPTINIETIKPEHFKNVAKIRSEFLNSKHMFCCLPLGVGEDESTLRKLYEKCPSYMKTTAVALLSKDEDDNAKDDNGKFQIVGFVQLCLQGMPADAHTVKPGEAYINMIAVTTGARGLGVGTQLLDWCEEVALSEACTRMTLNVLRGNPAIQLYERRGFEVQTDVSCIERCFTFVFLCCIFGPVICPVGSSPYKSCGISDYMEKMLETHNKVEEN